MSARVDSSPFSTVVWCTRCPTYSDLANGRGEGYDIAVAHEAAVHPESRVAEINRFRYLQKETRLAG